MLERMEGGQHEETEMEPKATLKEALQESAGSGLVFKPDLDDISGSIDRRLPELDLETRVKLEKYEGGARLLGHLFRLLVKERSAEEHNLANLMLDHYQELRGEKKVLMDNEEMVIEKFKAQTKIEDFDDYAMALDSLHQVPEGDCADTVMWWTYSPYLAQELHERGVDDKKILERLMDWGLPAAQKLMDEPNRVHLPGLDFIQGEDDRARTYILSNNPEGASHRFTRQKAKELVNGFVM